MRLGKLAKELNITHVEIINYIQKTTGQVVESNPNIKLEDDLIELTKKPFLPPEEEAESKPKEEVQPKNKPTPKNTEVEKTENTAEPTISVEKPMPKIISKIDLPEDSTKTVEIDGVVYDKEELKRKKQEEEELKRKKAEEKRLKLKKEKEARELEELRQEEIRKALNESHHNIALTEEDRKKIELEEKKKQERQKRLEKKQREQKKLHYLENHTAPKAAKKKKATVSKAERLEPKKEVIKEPVVRQPKPKKETNLLIRFLKWFGFN